MAKDSSEVKYSSS